MGTRRARCRRAARDSNVFVGLEGQKLSEVGARRSSSCRGRGAEERIMGAITAGLGSCDAGAERLFTATLIGRGGGGRAGCWPAARGGRTGSYRRF